MPPPSRIQKKQFNKAFAEFALVAVASVTASGKRVEPHSKESVQKITFYNNKEWCFADKNQVIEKSGSAVCRAALFRPPAALRGGSNNAHTHKHPMAEWECVYLLVCQPHLAPTQTPFPRWLFKLFMSCSRLIAPPVLTRTSKQTQLQK